MIAATFSPRDEGSVETGLRRRTLILSLAAVCFGGMAVLSPAGLAQLFFAICGSVIGLGLLVVVADATWHRRKSRSEQDTLKSYLDASGFPEVATDGHGRVLAQNAAARAISGDGVEKLIRRFEAEHEDKIASLLACAFTDGFVQESFPARTGGVRLTVRRMRESVYVWQQEPSLAPSAGGAQGGMPRLPMLTVGRTNTVLFMNAAARDLLGERKTSLDDIFGDQGFKLGQTNTIETAVGQQQCMVAQVDVAGGRREIYFLPTIQPTVQGGVIQFEGLPVALLKVSPTGRVLMANQAARKLVKLEVTANTEMTHLMEGLGRSIEDWLSEASAGRCAKHSEFLLLKREDREVFVQVSLNRVIEGDEVSLIAVLSDATELKTLEAQFVQSQKMQAIGQLAGGIAHDFNNLLTAISGHCDLLLLRHDQGDPDFGDLVQINQNANRAAALVGQLLAFSRKQNLRPEVLDLRNTLADLTHLLNRLVGEKVRLSLNHDPILRSVRADKRQLEQVIMNLVVNARDAMPDGGEISIHTESLHLKQNLTRDRVIVPIGHYVCVRVLDQGTGIPADKLQKVFEPFYTTKRLGEGTGLGLSTAYGIVKQTGGYIFVDSKIGQGTCFTLMFPVHEQDERPVAVDVVEKPLAIADSVSGIVLLVEDEAPVRSFASRALRLRGFTVHEASTGEEALDLLEDESLAIDLFVTDVVMPGMDGPTWVNKARIKRPDVRVVFVSGYAEDSFSDRQARIPNSVFLPKPFSLVDLTETVRTQLTLDHEMVS